MARVSDTFKARKSLKQLFSWNSILSNQNKHLGDLMTKHGDDHPEYGRWYDGIIQNNKKIRDNNSLISNIKTKHKLFEKSPPGFKGTVEAMKDHPEITNPWALAWWMKKKGYKSHKK